MKIKIYSNFLSYFTIFVATGVIVGWLLNIPILTSILPHWVTMKFTTAVNFFFCGLLLLSIPKYISQKDDFAQIAIVNSSFVLLLSMTTLFVASLLGLDTGIENIFIRESRDAVMTVKPGMPSFGTIFSFILVSVAGLLTIFNVKQLALWLKICGGAIGVLGLSALIGYVIDNAVLYYSVENLSTAMAVHTAILFIVIGMQLVCIASTFKKS